MLQIYLYFKKILNSRDVNCRNDSRKFHNTSEYALGAFISTNNFLSQFCYLGNFFNFLQ